MCSQGIVITFLMYYLLDFSIVHKCYLLYLKVVISRNDYRETVVCIQDNKYILSVF